MAKIATRSHRSAERGTTGGTLSRAKPLAARALGLGRVAGRASGLLAHDRPLGRARLVEAAHGHGAWVGVCGEAAAEPRAAAAFVGLGVDELSMTPNAVPDVKDELRLHTADALRAAAAAAMEAPDAAGARAAFKEALR